MTNQTMQKYDSNISIMPQFVTSDMLQHRRINCHNELA